MRTVRLDLLEGELPRAVSRMLARPLAARAFVIVLWCGVDLKTKPFVQFGSFPDSGALFIDCPPLNLYADPCVFGEAASRARALLEEQGVLPPDLVQILERDGADDGGGGLPELVPEPAQ